MAPRKKASDVTPIPDPDNRRGPFSAFRMVVPEGYQVFELQLVGLTPLLMSSADIDRRNKTYIAYKTLGRKRGKTPADEDRLRELEWHIRLYYDAEVGCFIPGLNLKELLRSAATKWKKGEDVTRSLIIPLYRNPLIYEGPRDPKDLWADGGFAYTTMVANSGAGSGRVERTRPMFREWALVTEVAIDPEELSPDDLRNAVDRSPKYGLGDRRKQGFGMFEPTLTFRREQHSPADADGAKARDTVLERVVASRAKALMKD